MKIQSLLLLLVFYGLYTGVYSSVNHKCRHDEIFKDFQPKTYKLSNFERHFRKNTQVSVQPIRIVIDYSNLKLLGELRAQYIKVMNLAKQFFTNRLKIYSTGKNTVLPASLNTCVKTTVPSSHKKIGFNGDLVIYATSGEQESETTAAWANYCHQDPMNGRPLAGQIHFGQKVLESIKTNKDFQKILGMAIHEITHILAFHDRLYKDFRKSFGSLEKYDSEKLIADKIKIGIREKYAIRTPKVLAAARDFFKCQSIPGLELEDEGSLGSAGSHWERSILHNEMMGAQIMQEETFSIFSLALLEDSGWYKPDYTLAEPVFFGKGAGCAFVERVTCYPEHHPGRSEWCNPDAKEPLCSLSGGFKGECSTNEFASCCHTVTPEDYFGNCGDSDSKAFKNVFEYYGRSGRCFIGEIREIEEAKWRPLKKDAFCLKTTCNPSKTEISIHLDKNTAVLCSKAGENVTVPLPYEGTIKCPDPTIHCLSWSCPNGCSRNGYCNKNFCECLPGWGGNDCSKRNGTNIETVEPEDKCQNVVCTGNRFCQEGVCQCLEGFVGPNCLDECPKNCSGNGICSQSKCFCDFGYSGDDCALKEYCEKPCSNRGLCHREKCYCLEGFSGPDCEIANAGYSPESSCPKNCHSDTFKGFCSVSGSNLKNLTCLCNDNNLPPDCTTPPNPESSCKFDCGRDGKCENGRCKCDWGNGGEACQLSGCIDNCGGRGSCEIEGIKHLNKWIYRRACHCKDGTKGMYCPPPQ